MIKNKDMLPCPFCGGGAIIGCDSKILNRGESEKLIDWCFIQCFDCGIRTADYDSPERAAEAWNRRTQEQKKKQKKTETPSCNYPQCTNYRNPDYDRCMKCLKK